MAEREPTWRELLVRAIAAFREEACEVLPEDFRRHSLAASREMLLALRSLIDLAIKSLEEEPPRRKAQQIKVE